MGSFLHYNVFFSVLEYAFVYVLLSGNFFLILVQLEIPVEPDQSFGEQGSPGNTSHSTALSTDTSLQEEKAEDTESSSVPVTTQEPSAATGRFRFFIFNVDTFLKATDTRCFVLAQFEHLYILAILTFVKNAYFYSLWTQFQSYAFKLDSSQKWKS